MAIGIIGIVLALVVLIVLCVKRVNLVIASLVGVGVICLFSQMNFYEQLTTNYAGSLGSFITSWFIVFFLGSLFGKIMDVTGSAQAIADVMLKWFGNYAAVIGMPLVIMLMVYGGVNGFVVVFTVWPMMDKLWRKIDAPRRLMPAMVQFAAGTAANGGPGSPNALNLVVTNSLGVTPYAGLGIGMIYNVVVMGLGIGCYIYAVRRAQRLGQHYLAPGAQDYIVETNDKALEKKPNGILSLLPLVITIFALNFSINGATVFPTEYALGLGVLALILINIPRLNTATITKVLGEAVPAAVVICASYGAMSGFGTVVKATPVFQQLVDAIPSLPGSPLISLFIATNLMCAVTGTATGAATIVAPILGPIYTGMGLSAAVVARVIAMSATALDSVPHNSGVINYIYTFGHEDFKSAYPMVFITSVVCPVIATIIAILAGMAFGLV